MYSLKANILINDQGDVCITDFGLSRILECSGFTTRPGGTLRWMALELIPVDDADRRVTTYTDVWAFAMTVLEVRRRPMLRYDQSRLNVFVVNRSLLDLSLSITSKTT